MEKIQKSFGENVRKRRKDLKLSQEELAYLTKRDTRSIIAIEGGDRNPTMRTIHSLCKALRISSSKLLPF